MQRQRVELEPAYVLHTRAFGDTSLLLEAFTARYGRVGLVAKGARAPKSKKRVLLQPLQPLLISWQGAGDLGTLTAVEASAAPLALTGEPLFCGWYANELLMRLLPRHDAHPQLFLAYAALLPRLAGDTEPGLRVFECALLDELGYGLGLDADLDPAQHYLYAAGQGLCPAPAGEAGCSGRALIALRDDALHDAGLLRQVRQLLRAVLRERLGGRPLETATLLRALRALPDGGG